jgi:hypothetical protein
MIDHCGLVAGLERNGSGLSRGLTEADAAQAHDVAINDLRTAFMIRENVWSAVGKATAMAS